MAGSACYYPRRGKLGSEDGQLVGSIGSAIPACLAKLQSLSQTKRQKTLILATFTVVTATIEEGVSLGVRVTDG